MGVGLREHLVAYFEEQQKLVEAGALRLILGTHQPLVLSREVVERAGSGASLVTEEMVASILLEQKRVLRPPVASVPKLPDGGEAAPAGAPSGFVGIREGYAPPGSSETPMAAYGGLFRARYRAVRRMLRSRSGLDHLRPVAEVRAGDGPTSVIAMVREVRETSKRHHFIVTLDDDSGSLDALVLKDTPPARETFVPDEIVGVKLRVSRDSDRLPVAIEVVRPDVPLGRTPGPAPAGRKVLLLSDLHVGSRSFLADSWSALVAFLEGNGPHPELARAIEYVVIAGDLVDGIGIYPRQERDLAIPDVVEQYAELGRRLRALPNRLTIVVLPGNHDAVCPAEPQPALPPNLLKEFPSNVRPVSNPSTFSLEGMVVTAYHGRGFDDLIPELPGASYARPTDVMKRMLQMRHLAPIYGGRTPLAPLDDDGLVVDPVPDLFVTGHLHTYGVDRYRGVLLVNASTWQSETDYQRMRNIAPLPARAAVVDLGTHHLVTVDCSSGEAVVGGPVA